MPIEKFKVQSTEEMDDSASAINNQTVGSFLWDLSKVVLIAFIVMVAFRYFVAEPFVVSGSSMVPNFHNKEYLIVDKVSHRFTDYKRGDVIVFHYPKDRKQFFIKRIIGLPGEKIQIEDGKIIIFNSEHPQGTTILEDYLPNQDMTFGRSDTVTLGSSEYYVLGDNRLASSDSRVWGVLPKSDIVGTAFLRAFPLNSVSLLKFPDPILE